MQTLIAILVGKAIAKITRLLKIGGGSAAPGLYSLKIDPGLVGKLAAKIPVNIVITGTNGKTTTAKMLAHFAKQNGLKVIRNHTGSNLERGIASTLISGSRISHLKGGIAWHLAFDIGIWELDEAAFNLVAPKLNPKLIIFLNIFRDQLDRYGEINSIVSNWDKTLQSINKDTKILVNGDDHNLTSLKKSFKGHLQQFGVKDIKITGEGILHKKEKENLDFEAKNVKLNGLQGSSFSLIINHKSLTINLPLPGIYHIYDTLAAVAGASLLDLPVHRYLDSLNTFTPAFGRVERFNLQDLSLPHQDNGYIFLIKNPAGATQVLQTIAPQLKPQDRLLLALNDNLADGRDVSWIWDGEFEKLTMDNGQWTKKDKKKFSIVNSQLSIIISGTRAYDLALRLKYAGFKPGNITVEEDLEKAFKQAQQGLKGLPATSSKLGLHDRRGRLFILPTYTAMLELQGILTKAGIKKHYWRSE